MKLKILTLKDSVHSDQYYRMRPILVHAKLYSDSHTSTFKSKVKLIKSFIAK
jgi:hypothetical protein